MDKKLRNIKLVIEYEGTNYAGWQIQKNARTVQEVITEALAEITGQRITLYGASRTDSGVHSRGQVANFLTDSRLTPYQLLRALNDHLPDDITVCSAKEVPSSFNSRYDVSSKTYRYTILNSRIPSALDRNFYYFVPYLSAPRLRQAGLPDGHAKGSPAKGGQGSAVADKSCEFAVRQMRKAARCLVGRHNFKAFATKSSQKEDCYRRIYSIKIIQNNNYIYIDIRGNGFLYNMVRTIVGTLLWVAQGRIKPEDIKNIIKSRDRTKAGQTVPAKGLCLVKVVARH